MSLLIWLVFGAIVGGIAKAVYPGKAPVGWFPTIGLGVVGSIVGGLPFGNHAAGLVFSVVGSVAVLFLYRWYEDSNAQA